MRIDITAARLDLTPAIKEYVETKLGSLGKLLTRFEKKGELTLFVEVARTTKHHKRGEVFYAEATITLPNAGTLRIEEYDADVRQAIDRVKDRLRLDIAKRKDRGVGRDQRQKGKIRI